MTTQSNPTNSPPNSLDPCKKKKKRTRDETDGCIVCEVSDESVSRCCGVDCPVSFHDDCLDVANPSFCPYCWFKIVSVKSNAFRDQAVKYLDKHVEEGSSDSESKERNGEVDVTDKVKPAVLQVSEDSEDTEKIEDGELAEDERRDVLPVLSGKEDDGVQWNENPSRRRRFVLNGSDNERNGEEDVGVGKKRDVAEVLTMQESFKGKEDDQVEQNKNCSRRRRLVLKGTTDSGTSSSKERNEQVDVAAVLLSMQVQQNENQSRRRRLVLNATDNEGNGEDHVRAKVDNKGAGKKRHVSSVLCMEESFSGKEDDEEQQNENCSRRRRLVLNATDSKQNGEEDVTRAKVDNKGREKKGIVAPFLCMQESYSGKDEHVQRNENRGSRRRLVLKDTTDSETSSSKEHNGGGDVTGKVSNKDAGKKQSVAAVSSMHVQKNESQRSKRRLILNDTESEFSSTKERNGEEEEVTKEITSSTKVTAKSKTVKREKSFFSKDKRKRLFWTPEEEDMLKVGVEKYAAEAKRNMPWRKVLEFGENVFHETRTPEDLKDKWRNMIKLGKVDLED